jgi:hypothetical protein
VLREARMEPPIQTEYFRSGGATILTYHSMSCEPPGLRSIRSTTNLHAGRRKRGKFLLHTIGDTGEHGGASREDDVSVEITTNIKIALED